MERRFEVGDRVLIVCPTSFNGNKGKEGSVIALYSGPRWADGTMTTAENIYNGYLVATDTVPSSAYQAHELRPIYDGNERVAWSECYWQPKQVKSGCEG